MRKIIFTRPDGGVTVVYPVINITEISAGFTEADAEQRAWDKLPVDAINPVFVDESAIPTDRTFRNAWEHSGNSVTQNITKAKTIAHEKRREARAEEFAPHDEVIMKQIPGADATAAESARATIRTKYATMQTAINAASTVDAIKSAMPQG